MVKLESGNWALYQILFSAIFRKFSHPLMFIPRVMSPLGQSPSSSCYLYADQIIFYLPTCDCDLQSKPPTTFTLVLLLLLSSAWSLVVNEGADGIFNPFHLSCHSSGQMFDKYNCYLFICNLRVAAVDMTSLQTHTLLPVLRFVLANYWELLLLL